MKIRKIVTAFLCAALALGSLPELSPLALPMVDSEDNFGGHSAAAGGILFQRSQHTALMIALLPLCRARPIGNSLISREPYGAFRAITGLNIRRTIPPKAFIAADMKKTVCLE